MLEVCEGKLHITHPKTILASHPHNPPCLLKSAPLPPSALNSGIAHKSGGADSSSIILLPGDSTWQLRSHHRSKRLWFSLTEMQSAKWSYLLTVKGKCSPLLLTLLDSTSLFYSQSDSLKANREQALLANFFVYPLYQPPTPSPSRHLDSVCQPLSLNMQQREALHSTFLWHS